MSAPEPPAGAEWLDSTVVSGEVTEPAAAARKRIFDEVSADRDGPVARRLLTLVTDERPAVRRTTLALLIDLCGRDRAWSAAAAAAECALGDPDEPVRRAAAWLLVAAGAGDRAIAAVDASADPVVRTALVEALVATPLWRQDRGQWPQCVLRLRSDRTPAVRLLADVEALRLAAAPQWPALDAAVRADLDAVDGVLGAPGSHRARSAGERWASAFHDLDREHDCCSWAERLLDPAETPPVRRAGMALAVEAMRTWRAAPARLAPTLSGILAGEPSPLRAAAARALSASLTATRLAADRLAAVLDDPEAGATAATALGCVGDQRAVPHLVRMMRAGSREPWLVRALTTLAPESAALAAAAWQMVTVHPDQCPLPWWECEVEAARRVVSAAPPSPAEAVPELTARVRAAMDRGDHAGVTWEVGILRRVGPAARAAVPLLRRYAATGGDSAGSAVHALLTITSDRAVADDYLAERPETPRHHTIAPALLTWLLDNGGLTDRQHRQLRHLFSLPGSAQLATAEALWRCEGPAAAADLLAELPKYLHDDFSCLRVVRVFAAMGEHARPVLDRVDGLIQSRRRADFQFEGPDGGIRADEALLAAALSARDQIAA